LKQKPENAFGKEFPAIGEPDFSGFFFQKFFIAQLFDPFQNGP